MDAALTTSESLLTCWNIKEAKTIPDIRTDDSAMLESPTNRILTSDAEAYQSCKFTAFSLRSQLRMTQKDGRGLSRRSPLPRLSAAPRGCALNGTSRQTTSSFFVCLCATERETHGEIYHQLSGIYLSPIFFIVTFLFCVSLLRVCDGTLCETSTNGMAEVTSCPAAADQSTQLV